MGTGKQRRSGCPVGSPKDQESRDDGPRDASVQSLDLRGARRGQQAQASSSSGGARAGASSTGSEGRPRWRRIRRIRARRFRITDQGSSSCFQELRPHSLAHILIHTTFRSLVVNARRSPSRVLSEIDVNAAELRSGISVGNFDPGLFKPAGNHGQTFIGVAAEFQFRLLALNDVDLDLPHVVVREKVKLRTAH
jgi:hypothetical protein